MEMNKIAEIFDSDKTKDKYLLDYYPHRIQDNDKYTQVECFYKHKFGSRNRLYYKKEKQMLKFLSYLWLYSDMTFFINVLDPKFNRFFNKKKLNICPIPHQNSFEIKQKKQLDYIGKLICRDYANAYIICKQFLNKDDIILYVSECTAILVIQNITLKEEISKIAHDCHLFLREIPIE